jgi:hypothetical protein
MLSTDNVQGDLDLIEKYADGSASKQQLAEVEINAQFGAYHYLDAYLAGLASAASTSGDACLWASSAGRGAAWWGGTGPKPVPGLCPAERRAQCQLLLDIFGSLPFRPVTIDPSVLAWNDGLVPRLAQAIYEERRWGDMPVLGDALLHVGCDSDEVVAHCRAGGEHVRGCWVLDLCLGKD